MTEPTPSSRQHVEVRPGAYADSVTLLGVSQQVSDTPGVRTAQVAMATPLNLDVLVSMGFDLPETTSNDMVVALMLDDEDSLDAALAAVDDALARSSRAAAGPVEQDPPRTIRRALADPGAADLALVSVPGEHALVEAVDALEADRDVMVFSDNVPLEHEVALKELAAGRGRLVMGPDCGTALVGGVGLGFANSTRPGPVGIVAASGTGCQQLMCLLDAAGVGVGAALGVGGRDLGDEVRARSTREALRRLDADPAIEVVVVVSKPPDDAVAADLRAYAEQLRTPVHLALLGPGRPDLTAAVTDVLTATGREAPTWPVWGSTGDSAADSSGRYLRGLFTGGTLCDEAMVLASDELGGVHSNIPLEPSLALDDSLTAAAHTMVDFGDDALTAGRAHPMIDPTLRLEHLARAAADPDTAVLLLDVVLGHGAEEDPARSLAPAITDAIVTARDAGRSLPVVVACVGTESDPQQLSRQAEALAAAGAEVHLSNARATRRAVALTGATR